MRLLFESLEPRYALDATAWSSFAGNSQHTSISTVASQALEAVHWSTPVDNFPTSRAAHYGGPLVTLNNTVIYPYKTGNTQSVNTPNYHIVARNGNDGALLWDVTTPYVPPSYSWYPQNQPVLATATNRVYFAGEGGTIYYRDNPDSATGTVTQLAFFDSMANYTANKSTYDNNVFIETPLTADAQGNIFFGFRVIGATPTNLVSGIARISANGTVTTAAGSWVSAFSASGNDANIGSVQQNSAPAISNDGQTLYIVVKQAGDWVYYGRLLGLSTTTLATQYNSGVLKDPRGANAAILNQSSSSPMVAPDGHVFLGVFGNPYNGSRGWMLHFSPNLQTKYTPGGFGWDTTPSIVPASLLGAQYTGTSQYLIFTKYNNYYFSGGANNGGDGSNEIAILDPNDTEIEFHDNTTVVMKRVLHKLGPTPDWDYPTVPTAVREWCINYGAVDPATSSVIVNSSDGKFYRWHLPTNTLIEPLTLTSGIGQPYTMTVIGVDGAMYGIQMGRLFALGQTPRMSISDPVFIEGSGGTTNATFTVSLDYPRTSDIAVDWATANGTAIAGQDYTAGSGRLVFNPGVKTRTITVAINPDLLDEFDEQFFVNLSGVSNAVLLDNQGQATISDDDAAPNLSIGDISANEGNTGNSPYTIFNFQVSLSTASGQSVGVQWDSADGTATALDYVSGSGSFSFAPGETTKTISIQIRGDTTFESNESFFVNLFGVVNAIVTDSQGQGTIVNDDNVPSVSINDVAIFEGEDAVFTISLSNTSSQTITLNYATANGTANALDYTAKSGALTFLPGETTKTVSVATNNDVLNEITEDFFLNLTSPVNAFIADAQGKASITDDDDAPTMSIGDISVNEGLSGTTSFVFTVLLSAASGQNVSVNYATANGTATTADSDYQSKSGSITFAAGEITKTITVLVNGDNVVEPDETFFVNLSSAAGAFIADNQAVGTILNDDSYVFSINDVTHLEGDSGTTGYLFTVALSSPSGQTTTVQYSTANDTGLISDGDYQAASGTLSFAPGETSKTFTVLANGDAKNELDETFFVNLSNPTGATLGDAQGLGVIQNDDPLPTLSVSDFGAPEMDYNVGTFTVYVTLSAVSGRTVTVDFRTENGTATSTSNIKDYIDTLGTLTFLPGETVKSFDISIVGDLRVEQDETIRAILSNASNATISDDLAIITIQNDDRALVTISGTSIQEGNSGLTPAIVTVDLSNPSDLPITIDFATNDGSAIAGQDYVAANGTITFAPGEQSKSITIQVNGDNEFEVDEDFEVILSNASEGAYLPYYPETDVDILNDDLPAPTLSGVSINGGVAFPLASPTSLPQRSQLVSVTVAFSNVVTLDAGAFILESKDLFGISPNFSASAAPLNYTLGPSNTFVITFGVSSGVNGVISNGVVKRADGPSATVAGNSLADGNYRLTIDPTKVHQADGKTLAGNNQFGAAFADRFFRMFGDGDGDGDVDGTDTVGFRRAQSTYNPAFDWDGNGLVTVNATDPNSDSSRFSTNNSKKRRIF